MQHVNVREGRPGQWIGVFGDALTLLVPGVERDRALRWWALVDDGATVELLLDALLADGLSTLNDFVLVDVRDDGRVRVVVRGSAALTAWTAEGQVRVQAAGRLWAEDDFVEIVALRVDLPGHDWLPPVSSFEVQSGLCRVGGVVWGTVPEPTEVDPPVGRPIVVGKDIGEDDEAVSGPTDEAVRVNVLSPVSPPAVSAPPSLAMPSAEPSASEQGFSEPAHSEAPVPDGADDAGLVSSDLHGREQATEAETAPLSAVPLEPSTPPTPPTPPAPPAPEPEPFAFEPFDPGSTASGLPTPVSTPIPQWQEEVTTHISPVELSGLTLLGLAADPADATGPADETDETQTRPERAAEATDSGPAIRLRFSHGADAALARPLVIGRAPAPRAGSPGAELITVPSPQQEISSNHVEIRPGGGVDRDTALVTDLGSTNGTVVTQPGLGPEELRPGTPMVVLPGAVIDLGDGIRIHVEQG